jgi:hypothetical protein
MKHCVIRRLFATAVMTVSLATADTIGEDVGTNARPVTMNTAAQAAGAQNVSIEIVTIGLFGSVAWLTGLGLRRRAFGSQSKAEQQSVNS